MCGTARGATVDAAGCPRDSDSDGILDGLDMCPDTDPRTLINEDGCPYDSDGDGLLEGIDQCPATPRGQSWTKRAAGSIRTETVWRTGWTSARTRARRPKSTNPGAPGSREEKSCCPRSGSGSGARSSPGSSPALNEVAETLKQNPDVTVEIGGHTDNEGPARLNRTISLERAEQVKHYLAARRGVPTARMATKGYGEVHPIASNRYAEGRAQNRRIELEILPPPDGEI